MGSAVVVSYGEVAHLAAHHVVKTSLSNFQPTQYTSVCFLASREKTIDDLRTKSTQPLHRDMTEPSLEDADIKDNTVSKWRWSLIEWIHRRFGDGDD